MEENNVYSLIGFARKSGKLKFGYSACLNEIKNKNDVLCLLAKDISYNTKKKIVRACIKEKISLYEFGEKEKFGKLMGRDLVGIVCLNSKDFIKPIKEYFQLNQQNNLGV